MLITTIESVLSIPKHKSYLDNALKQTVHTSLVYNVRPDPTRFGGLNIDAIYLECFYMWTTEPTLFSSANES